MRNSWTQVVLGDLVRRSDHRLGQGPEPTILTCTEGAGLIRQADKFKKRIAAADTSDYKTVRRGDLVYNPYLLWKGAIAQSTFAEECITSPVYEVLRPVDGVEARYLRLALTSPEMVRAFGGVSVGSIERRRRAVYASVVGLPVLLPPLAEQQRIVDLIGAVDGARARAEQGLAAAELLRRAVLLDLVVRGTPPTVPLTAVLADVIGGVWGSPAGEAEIDVAALGPAAFSAPTVDVDRTYSTPRSVNRERWNRRALRTNDIVLERSGGTNDRPVGRVIVAAADLDDVVPTDFMRLLRVDPARATPRYVFWWLWARYARGDTAEFQSKTTNIRNLRVADYLGQPMPLPSRDAQDQVAAVGDDLSSLVEKSRGVVAAISVVRSTLLADLLSGEHEIPESYDRFLTDAA